VQIRLDNLYVPCRSWTLTFGLMTQPRIENGNTWMDDSVEVFVDAPTANDANGLVGQLGGQFVITPTTRIAKWKQGIPVTEKPPPGLARTAVNGSGLLRGVPHSMALLGNPREGDIIGFNVAVNDDDDGARQNDSELGGKP